ncbi:E3 ubiquitin-protein ligase MPSR1 [Cynara cardunculus var. scolymus]|uniref:RING-type E3 ubiquitin transferase n=1 Tax=Cynara cardunculus var. scolymus TaxID=59895 RepID=A0A103YAH7_CYNCS|nr:E3 ubiquitin-protein ligase MPSR1 [Cynara cardunculus var. scolymus]KVI05512.1 hypothetical protein Ccrd_016131 [Cynara cardunculus var. scolymus]
MASEPNESVSSLIERLMSMPYLSGFTGTRRDSESDSDHDSEHHDLPPHLDPSLDRIILINPVTQGMVVIRGSGIGFDSLLNDLMRKEGQPPASQASIDAMPSLEVKSTDEIENLGGECVICLEEWKVGEMAKEMPCKHRFHGGCVEKWLKIHGSCPVCRHKMPVEDMDKENGDKSEGRRRRQVWVSFSFGNERSTTTSEEER